MAMVLQDWLAAPALNSVFRQLEEAGLAWCLLRDPRPDGSSGDIDLLVDREDFRRFSQILGHCGFVRVWRGPGTHVTFVGYDEIGDRWARLDVVTDLAFGSKRAFRTHLEMECLARRAKDGHIARLSPEDEFWALLLHFLLDKGAVPSRHQARLQELAPAVTTNGSWAQLIQGLCASGWTTHRIVECVKEEQWVHLKGLAVHLAGTWEKQHLLEVKGRALINAVSQRAARVAKILRRPGVSVALLGSDGAGKSTLSLEISKTFTVPVRIVYMGQKRSQPPAPFSLVPGLGLAYKLILQWMRWLAGMAYRRRGRVVIFDRYSYDALYPKADGLRRRTARWLMAYTCPPPNLTILLDASPEILHERKFKRDPEGTKQRRSFDLDTTRQKRERYLEIASSLPRVTVVDTSGEPEEARRQATSLIWRAYASRRRA
jgi:thymidylate kinase-like protein